MELGKGSRLRRSWSDSQLGRSNAAPTVGLSKIRCCNDQIIFKITCVYLYYRRRGEGSKKKVGDSGSRFPFWEFWYQLTRSKARCHPYKVLLTERPPKDPSSRKEREKDGAPAFCAQGKRGPAPQLS
jgi:hypothetical protein